LVWHLLLLKRSLKAPRKAQRALQPTAGDRRGAECPELLVFEYFISLSDLLKTFALFFGPIV